MLQQSTLDFLKALKKNNNREWFEKNRTKYESAKDDYNDFVAALIPELAKVNPALAGLEVKDCVFRIYRDVRFSKNKVPYKTNMGAYFAQGGKKSVRAGFYIQVEPGACFMAGGCWMPQAPELKAIRQEIDYNLTDLNKILSAKTFKSQFKGLSDFKLKTTPKGYTADNPGIDFIRQTSFIVETGIDDRACTQKDFVKKCVAVYKTMYPYLQFLNRAMD